MRAAAEPAPGTRHRASGPPPARPPDRPRGRRTASALALTGAVLLLHAGLLRDGDRTPGRPTAPAVTSIQVRSVPAVAASPAPAALPVLPAAGPPARPAAVARARPQATPAAAPAPAGASPPAPSDRVARESSAPAATTDAQPAVGVDAPAGSPLPVYVTRVPPPARLRYEVRRGASTAEATVDWQVGDGSYRLRLQTQSPQGKPVEQLSEGGFDAAGLAPVRLADRRRGGTQAANFERERARISFSGARAAYALEPGTQDRLSWMVQLSAIGAAGAVVDGAELALQVVGARGAFSRWRFGVERVEALASPLGAVQAWRLVREPEHLYDLRVEVWLDPLRGWWPVRLRQTQVPGGEPVDWWLAEEPAAPAGT